MTSIPLLKKESKGNIYDHSSVESNPPHEDSQNIELEATTTTNQCFDTYKRQSKRISRLSRQMCLQTKYISLHRPKIKRWKLYEGKSRLYCHGRIVTGNDNVTFLLSMLLIIAPCVLFVIYVLPEFHIAFTYIFIYLALFCSASLLKTSWTDPGILPRNLEPQLNEVPINTNNSPSYPTNAYDNSINKRYNGSDSAVSSSASSSNNKTYNRNTLPQTYPFITPEKTYIPPMRNIVVNGRIISQKFCSTCKIYRPPRSFHCNFCDNCVENCDHHCPWTANCIGKRNYRFFYAFITSCTAVCIFVFFGSIIFLYKKRQESNRPFSFSGFIETIFEYPIPFILFVFVLLVSWSVSFLSCYHTYLIFKNITTHEQLKEQYVPNTNRSYFSTGNGFKNMMLVLFRPIPPSRFAMRQYVSVPLNPNPEVTTQYNPSSTINPFLNPPSSTANYKKNRVSSSTNRNSTYSTTSSHDVKVIDIHNY